MMCGWRLRTRFEPPVDMSLYSPPLFTWRLASASTARTFCQGTFSSSATSCATEVMPPWPISVCGTRTVTTPVGSIVSHALISVPPAGAFEGSDIAEGVRERLALGI